MKTNLDVIDNMILNELQKNARITVNQLSQIVHLSDPAIARRIQVLEEKGIILGYTTKINPSKIGMNITGYIIASVKKVEISRLIKYIEDIEEITSCETIIAGGKELIMRVVCKDSEHLMRVYDKLPFSYVEDMTAYIVLNPAGKDGIIQLDPED